MLNDLQRNIAEMIIDELDYQKGNNIDLTEDLAYTLFEEYNRSGSYAYSTYKAREWLCENAFDIADMQDSGWYSGMVEFERFFANPEGLQVQIIIVIADELLSQIDFDEFAEYLKDEYDDEEVELTNYEIDDRLINWIKEEVLNL